MADFSLSYGTSYSALLNQAQSMYGDILSGYENALSAQQGAQPGIQAGYGALQAGVMGQIQGVDASQRQALADVYAQQSGAATQQAINSGLGNTTVQGSMQRGLLFDYAKANVALSNQMAQLKAGYMSQLGLAGLTQQQQALQQQTATRLAQTGYQGQWQGDLLRAALGLYGQGHGLGGGGGYGGSSPIQGPGGFGGGGSRYGLANDQSPQAPQYMPTGGGDPMVNLGYTGVLPGGMGGLGTPGNTAYGDMYGGTSGGSWEPGSNLGIGAADIGGAVAGSGLDFAPSYGSDATSYSGGGDWG